MLHKVFLVEDEIVTREGIRDSVDWAAAGYQFCGEAPDGELALPLIQERKPDTVITDIRMPFMDGLQLCRLLKDSLPETKIIILSGHSEFKYAQEAIGLGVTEYLLKPVSAQELLAVLHKVGRQIEHEQRETEQLRNLELQTADYSAVLRERLLLQLVTGVLSSGDAIAQGRSLGLDLLAPWYQLLVVRAAPGAGEKVAPHVALAQVSDTIAAATAACDRVILFKKEPAETILLLKGNDPDQLWCLSHDLANLLREQFQHNNILNVNITSGQPGERLGMIAASYSQMLHSMEAREEQTPDFARKQPGWRTRLGKPDTAVMARLFSSGVMADFERSFEQYLAPLGDLDARATVLIDYVFTDLVLSAASFVRELGGDSAHLLRDLSDLESRLAGVHSLDQAKDLIRQVIERVLNYRDMQTHGHRGLIAKARTHIDLRYADADISLSSVAAQVLLSPSYFSVIFAREVHETFIEYLTNVRIGKAKELLRSTPLATSEIAYRVGYNNPRYFYAVFRKVVGASPNEFRRPNSPLDAEA